VRRISPVGAPVGDGLMPMSIPGSSSVDTVEPDVEHDRDIRTECREQAHVLDVARCEIHPVLARPHKHQNVIQTRVRFDVVESGRAAENSDGWRRSNPRPFGWGDATFRPHSLDCGFQRRKDSAANTNVKERFLRRRLSRPEMTGRHLWIRE